MLVPRSPAEITPELLTAALRQRGFLERGTVADVGVSEAGGLRGFAGHILRLSLEFDGERGEAPATLIAKLPAVDRFGSSQAAGAYAAYANEIAWYEQVALLCPPRTPALYWSGAGEAGEGRYCLLLEDVKDCHEVAHEAGPTRRQAEAAVVAVGRLHGTFAGTAGVSASGFRGTTTPEERGARAAESVRLGWDSLVEVFGRHLSPPLLAARDALIGALPRLSTESIGASLTLIHGDYKAENLLFGSANSPEDLVVLDWQGAGTGYGVEDLARFLSVSLVPPQRRLLERDLLRRYASAYRTLTGLDYAADTLWNDYRVALLLEFGNSLGGLALSRAGQFSADSPEDAGAGHRQQAIEKWISLSMTRRIAAVLDTDALGVLSHRPRKA